jgi:Carbohydrate-selective porin, OprB family
VNTTEWKRSRITALLFWVFVLFATEPQGNAQEQPGGAGPQNAPAAAPSGTPAGLLPVPDYSGDLWTRQCLTGDWGDVWTALANKGIQRAFRLALIGISSYSYNRIQTLRLSSLLGIKNSAQGFECFYNAAITPACHLTLDLQVVDSPQKRLQTATVLGLRSSFAF